MDCEEVVRNITGGAPYIFVAYPYEDKPFFQEIKEIGDQEGLLSISADEWPESGEQLLDKVHCLIEHADCIIADISKPNANVFYEVGYAKAIKKRPLLIASSSAMDRLPTDLLGTEVIRRPTIQGDEAYRREIRRQIRLRMGDISLVREMLLPEKPFPGYILAHPRPPHQKPVLPRYYEKRTFGDYLGIRAIFAAIGAVAGVAAQHEVHLLSSQYRDPEIPQSYDANLYLIGSPKVCPDVQDLLQRLQNGRSAQSDHNWQWHFGPAGFKLNEQYPTKVFDFTDLPVSTEVELYRVAPLPSSDRVVVLEGFKSVPEQDSQPARDYGLILRGPSPNHQDRQVLILAGTRSLGTGAACLAGTQHILLSEINEILTKMSTGSEFPLGDRSLCFWALVSASNDSEDKHIDESNVQIERVGIYTSSSSSPSGGVQMHSDYST